MIVIPIVLILAVIIVVLVIRHNRIMEKRKQMELGYMDTIEYIQSNNYIRAQECCKDAMALAERRRIPACRWNWEIIKS